MTLPGALGSGIERIKTFTARTDYLIWGITVVYFALFSFLRLGPTISPDVITFFLGAMIVYPLMIGAETFLGLSHSPFHSIFFQLIFGIVTLFALTSTVHVFGKGAVLALFFVLMMLQTKEFIQKGNFSAWFGTNPPNVLKQRLYLIILFFSFFIMNIYLF